MDFSEKVLNVHISKQGVCGVIANMNSGFEFNSVLYILFSVCLPSFFDLFCLSYISSGTGGGGGANKGDHFSHMFKNISRSNLSINSTYLRFWWAGVIIR